MEHFTPNSITKLPDRMILNNSQEARSKWQGESISQRAPQKQWQSWDNLLTPLIVTAFWAFLGAALAGCAEEGPAEPVNRGQEEHLCPVPPAVATLSSGTEIFLHEASRTDATGLSAGQSNLGACSTPGVLPITGITFKDARELCQNSGFDLCTLDDWFLGCTGDVNYKHPYGHTEQNGICNDFLSGYERVLPTMEMSACVSPDGLYDMVGNLWEWVYSHDPQTGEVVQEYMGGSYRVTDMTRHMKPTFCGARITPIQHFEYYAADLGFRCCRSPEN